MIQADERKLRQVVFNLLSNAVKFTPAGRARRCLRPMTDGVVEIAVADTGSGIAPEDQELIFEEFQQAARRAAVSAEGTGLGLPLVPQARRDPRRPAVGRERRRRRAARSGSRCRSTERRERWPTSSC